MANFPVSMTQDRYQRVVALPQRPIFVYINQSYLEIIVVPEFRKHVKHLVTQMTALSYI